VHHNQTEEFLGVDVGERRVGLARGSSLARLAEPLKTVPAEGAVEEIAALASLHGSSGVVVGLPRGLNGSETVQTQKVRRWVKTAQTAVKLPFYWQDEALTSLAAADMDSSAGSDAAAAAIILQDFLDSRPEQRVRC